VGEWLALGRDRIAERLGPEAVALFNRVSPETSRPLNAVAPAETFAEQMEFEHLVETIEPLLFVLRRFVEQLARRLEWIGLVVAEFQLRLQLESGARHERAFKIPSPTGNVETLFRMLHTHLETVRTDSPIVALRLEARPGRPERHQFGLFETTLRNPNQFAETLARLTALCGADRVGTPEPEATHRPDAFRMAVPEFGGSERRSPARSAAPGTATGVPGAGLALRRFRPALSARIEFREGRPVLLRSPLFNGPLVDVRGPFLSSGDWWDNRRWAREEWDVQTADGALYRIFQSETGGFVEGIYD
jgi:protein ImuB